MADQTKEQAKPQPKAKSAAELHKEYQALAAECTKLSQERPKVLRAVQERVKAETGDFDKKLAGKLAQKRAAYVAYEAAVGAEFVAKAK